MSASPAASQPMMRRHAWALYLGLGAALVLAYYVMPGVRGNGLLFNLIGLSPVAAIVIGVRRNRPSARRAWYLLALGQVFFVTGDAFYYGYAALFNSDAPFPSLGDLFYLSVYPSAIAGLLILIRRRSPGGNRNSLIDALIITIGLALLAWVFLILPFAQDPALTVVQKVVSIAYPVMDVCLLAVAVRLTVEGGFATPSLRMLVLGILALLATDAVYGLLTLNGGYDLGGVLDVGWAAYYLLWGAAALHPSMRDLEEPVPPTHHTLTWSRIALLTMASLMAPVVRVVETMRGIDADEPVLIVSSVALFVLVITRMAGVVRDREIAAARERAMREAAHDLVSASSRQEVLDAALPSLRALVGDNHDLRIAVLQPSGQMEARALDADGPVRWPVKASDLTPLSADRMRAHGALEVPLSEARLRRSLRVRDDADHLLVLPLFVREQLRGLLFVASPWEISGEVRVSLQTMSVQIALALESSILAEAVHTRRSEKRFRSLVQHSSDLIAVVDANTVLTYISPSVQRILGYDVDELLGARFYDLMHRHDRDHVIALLADGVEGVSGDMVECRLRDAGGAWLDFEIRHTTLLKDENVAGIVINARDVSERKVFEAQLRHQAFHDPVTKLANRALFTDRVDHALARMTRDTAHLAVLFVDLDDFKVINDSLGHAAGDAVLGEVARRLRSCVRTMDTVARFGGDEFAVLVEDVARPEDVARIADHILEAIGGPITVEDKEIFVGASMGIAMTDAGEAMTSGADELIRNADIAMYTAKRDGKGQCRVFESHMHAAVLERLELKGALQRAIERGELVLHHQPIVSLDGGGVTGVEALVRWRHPDRGLVPPGDFIPVAEETGLIGALGRWVLREACTQGAFLQQMFPRTPPLGISVNVSVRQLGQPGLVAEVAEAIEESGIHPSTLTLEITESFLLNDSEPTIAKLRELKGLGVNLSVDDFGTGYSSLSYLSKFPVDCLKIDRSFVAKLSNDDQGSALVAAIVKIAESLDLRTVAEGIDGVDQLDALRRMGCASGQGFLFARPLEFDELIAFLGARDATPATAQLGTTADVAE